MTLRNYITLAQVRAAQLTEMAHGDLPGLILDDGEFLSQAALATITPPGDTAALGDYVVEAVKEGEDGGDSGARTVVDKETFEGNFAPDCGLGMPLGFYDDGSAVYLASYAGGGHPEGAWSRLSLRIVDANQRRSSRTLVGPSLRRGLKGTLSPDGSVGVHIEEKIEGITSIVPLGVIPAEELGAKIHPRDIGWAKRRLVEGNRVARAGWNGKGMWLEYVQPERWETDALDRHEDRGRRLRPLVGEPDRPPRRRLRPGRVTGPTERKHPMFSTSRSILVAALVTLCLSACADKATAPANGTATTGPSAPASAPASAPVAPKGIDPATFAKAQAEAKGILAIITMAVQDYTSVATVSAANQANITLALNDLTAAVNAFVALDPTDVNVITAAQAVVTAAQAVVATLPNLPDATRSEITDGLDLVQLVLPLL
jgi:hypothetical protein